MVSLATVLFDYYDSQLKMLQMLVLDAPAKANENMLYREPGKVIQ